MNGDRFSRAYLQHCQHANSKSFAVGFAMASPVILVAFSCSSSFISWSSSNADTSFYLFLGFWSRIAFQIWTALLSSSIHFDFQTLNSRCSKLSTTLSFPRAFYSVFIIFRRFFSQSSASFMLILPDGGTICLSFICFSIISAMSLSPVSSWN